MTAPEKRSKKAENHDFQEMADKALSIDDKGMVSHAHILEGMLGGAGRRWSRTIKRLQKLPPARSMWIVEAMVFPSIRTIEKTLDRVEGLGTEPPMSQVVDITKRNIYRVLDHHQKTTIKDMCVKDRQDFRVTCVCGQELDFVVAPNPKVLTRWPCTVCDRTWTISQVDLFGLKVTMEAEEPVWGISMTFIVRRRPWTERWHKVKAWARWLGMKLHLVKKEK